MENDHVRPTTGPSPDSEDVSGTSADLGSADLEKAAGRELRRLRIERGWTQEEVARRMKAFGYDYHQTMIAKVESGGRPLRVNELAAFASLYGIRLDQLVYPEVSGESVAELLVDVRLLEAKRTRLYDREAQLRSKVLDAQADLAEMQREVDVVHASRVLCDLHIEFLNDNLARVDPDRSPAERGQK